MPKKRAPRVAHRGLGWLWPPQPCGLPYEKFRTGLGPRELYKQAYEWLAYRKNERGESFRPSDKKIKGQMGYLKHLMYSEYLRSCEIEQAGGLPAKTWADCRRVCKSRSNACGKSCVSKSKKCKKLPPEAGICNITDFQTNLPLERASEEAWEERRAAGAEPEVEGGDTSFDFAPTPPSPFPPAVDDDVDFGYEPPSRYGFTGLGRLSPAQKRAYAIRRLVTPAEVARRLQVPVERLPEHVVPYARFMAESASGEASPRAVVKAYVITRSSMRRQGRSAARVCETFPGYRELRAAAVERGEEVRPEDAMSVLLGTEDGKAYLDAAERGKFAAGAAGRLVRKMRCFGLTPTLRDDLEKAVRVGQNDRLRTALRSSSPEEWIELVDTAAVPGIGPAKAGFFASLLGRGDVPTFDARELDLWQRTRREPQAHDVLALRERIAEYPMALPSEYEPYRQHLTHHALWDATASTQTTHQEVIDAMRFAGLRSGGHGGAAANRGKYKPLPPGQSAIEQHRALEAAREQIIRAVESGAFELCPKGSKPTTTAPSAPSGGTRTASEWAAIKKRMEAAGW